LNLNFLETKVKAKKRYSKKYNAIRKAAGNA
jgi:hypothetical protein